MFLFYFKASSRLQENQSLEFQTFKFYGVIKCISVKQGIYFTQSVNRILPVYVILQNKKNLSKNSFQT